MELLVVCFIVMIKPCSYSWEDFTFMDARVLHPGTLVVKFGAATGITCGQLIGIRSLTYTEKGVEFAVTDAVVVQLEPGQRFATSFIEHTLMYKPKTTWFVSNWDRWWKSIAVVCGVLAR